MKFGKKNQLTVIVLVLLAAFFITSRSYGEDPMIRSRAAVVMEAETGRILYAKNPDLRLLPASTAKLMTALVVLDKLKLSDVVAVSKNASLAAPTRMGLKEGDKVTVETLLYASLMKSANDAAVALAEAAGGSEEQFVQLMNRKALAIGATDTRYINANGLPGKGQSITAYDLARIMRQAIKYPVLKEIIGTKTAAVSTEGGRTVSIRNTNRLLWSDDDVLGGKTGYTRQARHCFVCAGEKENETLIVSLLGAPSRDLLWKETEELMAAGSKVASRASEPLVFVTKNEHDLSSVSAGDAGGVDPNKTKKLRRGRKRSTAVASARRRAHGNAVAVSAKSSHKRTVVAHNKKKSQRNRREVRVAEKQRKVQKA